MSHAPADFSELLQNAVQNARASAPRAVDDLVRLSSRTADAVAKVTGGEGVLELAPLPPSLAPAGVYQLYLRRRGSDAPPSDLGVYQMTAAGYPILRWSALRRWEEQRDKPDAVIESETHLEGDFRFLLTSPVSRLVTLVAFLQQRAAS
jgi:hypothetical protein